MASVIAFILYVIILVASGQILQVFKKVIGALVKGFLWALSFFGLKYKKREVS